MPMFRNSMEQANRNMSMIIPLMMRMKKDKDDLAFKEKTLQLAKDELDAEANERAEKFKEEAQKVRIKTLQEQHKTGYEARDENLVRSSGMSLRDLGQPTMSEEVQSPMLLDQGNPSLRWLTKPEVEKEPGMTEADLTKRALGGDKTAQGVLEAMALRKKETATAGKTDVSVTNKIGDSSMTELGKQMAKDLVSERKDVEGAVSGLQNLQQAKKILDDGVITGTGAEFLTNMGNFLSSRLGIKFDNDPIANTQAYAATMGTQVGQIIKQFGSGTGLSDADREYAEKIVGGNIAISEGAIRKLMAINEKAFKNVVTRYNKKADAAMKKSGAESLPYDLRVEYEEPEAKKEIAERRRTPDGKTIVKYKDGSLGYE